MGCAVYNYIYQKEAADKIWDNFWQSLTIQKQLRDLDKLDVAQILTAYLPKKAKIIDAGCGLGKWVLYLSSKGYDIRGVDSSKGAVEAVKRFDKEVLVKCGDVCNLDYPDNSFDVYISFGVISYFKEGPSKALQEAKRVLRKDGLLFLKVPMVNAARIINDALLYRPLVFLKTNNFIRKLFNKPLLKKQFMGYRYSRGEFIRFLQKEGFEILHLIPHNYSQGLGHSYVEPDVWTGKLRFFKRYSQKLAVFLNRVFPGITAPILVIARNKKAIS